MDRALSRMVIGLLLVPTLGAWGEDKIPQPMRLATSEKDIPPEGASDIGVTTKLVEVSLTKLEMETGIKLEWAANNELTADKLQAIVAGLRQRSSRVSGAGQTSPAADAEEFLDAMIRSNIAKEWTSAGEITATGQPNRLVVGGLESTESHDAVRRTQSSNQMSFYAMARDEGRIALDLRARLTIQGEVLGPDDAWQPAHPVRQQEWQVATMQVAGKPTIWMGAIEEQTVAVEKRTWYGGTTIEERVTHVGTMLVVTAEMKEPRQRR